VYFIKNFKLLFAIMILFLIVVFVSGCAQNNKVPQSLNVSASPASPTDTLLPMMVFTVTPIPDMVYPKANTSPIEHTITPNASLEENYSKSEYPRIIDNGNGTINVMIYPKSATGQMVQIFYENEQLTYSTIPTRTSENDTLGPMVVRGMEVDDSVNLLKVQIYPLSDGTGTVNIFASTPLGNYRFNGTIIDPLEMQPILYEIGDAYPVENDQIQIAPGYYLYLAPVQERNQTFYVITKTVEGNQTQ
jgi:hypothetical protein